MEDFGSLLILLVILWRVLAGVLGRGQQPRPPGRPGGGQRPEGRSPEPRVPEREMEPQAAASASAADMIPDELWEILTGERRRPAPVSAPEPPVPVPVPAGAQQVERAPSPERLDRDKDGSEGEWEDEWEPALPPRPVAREVVSLEVEPVIRSLEEVELSPGERHAAFRAKIVAPPAPAGPARRRKPVRLNLRGQNELVRAMILQEVLGPPKALE